MANAGGISLDSMGQTEEHDFRHKLGDYLVSVKSLGQGSYAKVRLASHKVTKEQFAIKIIKKPAENQERHYTRIKREVENLRGVTHPNIIQLHDVFQTKRFICIVTEFAPNGDLFDYIQAQPNKIIEEEHALQLFWQMVDAVNYCHAQKIVHRDLKPENVLLDKNNNVKIADFGFSRTFDSEEQLLSTCCGSLGYAAPELLMGKKYVGKQADLWSLGVILYTMLNGKGPFGVEEGMSSATETRMMNGIITDSSKLSPFASSIISMLLKPNPNDRATVADLLQKKAEHDNSNNNSNTKDEMEESVSKLVCSNVFQPESHSYPDPSEKNSRRKKKKKTKKNNNNNNNSNGKKEAEDDDDTNSDTDGKGIDVKDIWSRSNTTKEKKSTLFKRLQQIVKKKTAVDDTAVLAKHRQIARKRSFTA